VFRISVGRLSGWVSRKLDVSLLRNQLIVRRKSYCGEDGKVKKRIIANLTALKPEVIVGLIVLLKGGSVSEQTLEEPFEIERALPVVTLPLPRECSASRGCFPCWCKIKISLSLSLSLSLSGSGSLWNKTMGYGHLSADRQANNFTSTNFRLAQTSEHTTNKTRQVTANAAPALHVQ